MIIQNIVVSTTPSLEGWKVKSHLDVIAVHVVAGANIFSDAFASFSDIFGGRSKSYQKQLSSINKEAIKQLKQKAASLGANCIVGLSIDHDEVSGKGKSMFMVTVSGTAVIAEHIESKTEKNPQNKANLDSDRLNNLVNREKIITLAKNDRLVLNDKNWKFIIENQVSEIAPYILRSVGNLKQSENSKRKKRNLKDYFYNISQESAKYYLYDVMRRRDGNMQKYAYNLLKDMSLFDYDEAVKFLQDDNFANRKDALGIAQFDKLYYTQNDIEKFEDLKSKIETTFKKRGKVIEVKKTFSSKTKQMWECECSKQNSLNEEFCLNCQKNIYGFNKWEIIPKETINFLETKINVLKKHFSENGAEKAV